MRRLAVVMGALAVLAAVAAVALPRSETAEERVSRIAAELRCVVCQGLSVDDSPSESAREMRAIVQQRVAEGRSDDEIRDEFRAAYGEWILLSPPTGDARGLVWLAPLAIVAAGLLLVMSRLRTPAAPERPTAEQLTILRERERLEDAEA
ncbi:MAG: cytochrome c-type biogenesis protein [Candidatus Limnocylindria bacterium]